MVKDSRNSHRIWHDSRNVCTRVNQNVIVRDQKGQREKVSGSLQFTERFQCDILRLNPEVGVWSKRNTVLGTRIGSGVVGGPLPQLNMSFPIPSNSPFEEWRRMVGKGRVCQRPWKTGHDEVSQSQVEGLSYLRRDSVGLGSPGVSSRESGTGFRWVGDWENEDRIDLLHGPSGSMSPSRDSNSTRRESVFLTATECRHSVRLPLSPQCVRVGGPSSSLPEHHPTPGPGSSTGLYVTPERGTVANSRTNYWVWRKGSHPELEGRTRTSSTSPTGHYPTVDTNSISFAHSWSTTFRRLWLHFLALT